MQKFLLGPLAAAFFAAAPAFASDTTDALAPIHQFIDGINKGDMQAAAQAYAPEASIIDEFPPHAWHSTTVFADWAKDFNAFAKPQGVTDPIIKLGKPKHVDVTGDRAYVVVPADFLFKVHGKPVHEPGCYMDFRAAEALRWLAHPGLELDAPGQGRAGVSDSYER